MELKQELLKQADKARKNAYAPYSGYKVGAAVYAESGKIFSACNVENVSFPCGTCAEAGALAAMVTAGEKKIKAILVLAEGKNLVYPCGACLQRIAEFSDAETVVYLADKTGVRRSCRLTELLPCCFNAEEVGND